MASVQEFTRLKATAERDGGLAWLMMLDALIFQAEAEARWVGRARVGRDSGKFRQGGAGDALAARECRECRECRCGSGACPPGILRLAPPRRQGLA